MIKEFVSIDFEFTDITEKYLTLVCVSLRVNKESPISFNLTKEEGKEEFIEYINQFKDKKEAVLLAYAADAEQRCFLTLGLEWNRWRWIDIRTEYKMLQNKRYKYSYGKQLLNGRVKTTTPPSKWKTEGISNDKPSTSLASCCYKMIGVVIDTVEKDAVRDMIIQKKYTVKDLPRIIKYCESDVLHLTAIFKEIVTAILSKIGSSQETYNLYLKEALNRGVYSGLVARMVHVGYPLAHDEARSLTGSVPSIMEVVQNDINKKTRKELGFDIFEKGKKQVRKLGDFILEKREQGVEPYTNWLLSTKTGRPSLKEEFLTKLSGARHNYRDNFIDQLIRYQSVYRTLNGFAPAGTSKKNFWDSVGTDHQVRPYFNQFGSQSSRSQPSSTGFIPLKSAWTRYLIQPPEGKVMVTIDYGSEEYLIAALLTKDKYMIDAYMQGDVYLGFGKDAGIVPRDATKKSHGLIREKLKQTVLMVLYGAGSVGLATRLATLEPDKPYEKILEEAGDLIALFEETYSSYIEAKEDIWLDYKDKGYLRLKDGWYMWGDNTNEKSVKNCPFQGAGAVVMRQAHKLAHLTEGLEVVYTLHDALTIICDVSTWKEDIKKLCVAMDKGFSAVCGTANNTAYIKLDANVWGHGLENGSIDIGYTNTFGVQCSCPTKVSERYIDSRSIDEFNAYKTYFNKSAIEWF